MVPGPPPSIPLRVPVSAVIEAEGELPEIEFKTRFDFEGGGWATADGSVALHAPPVIEVGLTVHEVNPQVIADVRSATPLNAKAHARIELGSALDMKIDADATTEPFMIAGNPIPAVDAKAALDRGVLKGALKVDEAGAPLHGTFSFDMRNKKLGFEAETRVADLRGIRRVKVPVDGSATVKVKGTLEGRALDARVSAHLDGIRASGGVALAGGAIEARVKGPVDAPGALGVDATVSGSGLQAGYLSWERVSAHAAGPLFAPEVDAALDTDSDESLKVSGAVDVKAKELKKVKVLFKRKSGEVGGQVERVAATPGGIKVEGIALEGASVGELKGGLTISGKEIVGKLRGQDVDLDKVAHLLSYPGHLAGRANVDIDLSSKRPGDRSGHVAIELVDGEVNVPGPKGVMVPFTGLSGVFTATFDGDHVRSDGLLRLITRAPAGERAEERCDGAIAQLRITGGDGRIPGPILDPASWRSASGTIELAADDWNLRCLRRAATSIVPLPDLRGKLTTRVTVERSAEAKIPTVKSFFAQTKGLEIIADKWDSHHTDLKVEGALDGTTGETRAKLAVLDTDPLDPLASVEVKTTLDLPASLDPKRRNESLLRAPLHGEIHVPRRPITAFAGLPSFVTDALPLLTGSRGDTLAGELAVDGKLDGSARAPRFEQRIQVWNLAQVVVGDPRSKPGELRPLAEPVLGPWGLPIDADVTTTYDGQKVDLSVRIANQGRTVTNAGAEVALPVGDVLAGRIHPKGSFHAELDRMPLGSLPYFDDKGIAGKLSGTVKVTGIGDKPSVHAELGVPGLKVNRVAFDDADLSIDVDEPQRTATGERSTAKLQLTLKGGNGGAITTSVSQGVAWKDGLVPSRAPDSAAKLDLTARGFRVAVAEPFIQGLVSRLDGVLDGETHLSFHAGEGKAAARTSLDKVDLRFSKGVLNLPQLGQELSDVNLTVAAGEGGKVVIKDVRARGTKGMVTGSGYAKLEGLVLDSAELALLIKPGEELPITIEGTPFGEARGKITFLAQKQKNGDHDVKIGVPSLHIDLAPAVGRLAQSVEDNPDVEVLHVKRVEPKVTAAEEGTKTVITIDPLNIELKGKIAGNVPVEGTIAAATPVKVALGGKRPQVEGTLSLPRFQIEVLRKPFVIEHGRITLSPDDVSKSFIKVSARWDAPEGPAIVEYEGDAASLGSQKLADRLKCTWGSLAGSECLTAVFIGSGQGQGQALAGQLLAQQFSTDLGGGISTSVEMGDDGSIRPGLKWKVGPFDTEVSTYGAGGGATTTTSGNAAPKGQHSLGTLDWRFWRNWNWRLKVDVGNDQQTFGTDVLWQYRY
jgi:translocation and assembly module TamB